METKHILVVDDHPIVANGIIEIIRDMKTWPVVFSEAHDFSQALQALQGEKFDLVILDVNMPNSPGFDMISKLRALQPDVRILVFSSNPENTHAVRFLQEGASGYIQKDTPESGIREAITAIMLEGKYLSAHLFEKIISTHNEDKSIKKNPFEHLTNRELDICNLLVKGLGTLEISNQLGLKITTVSTYKSRIFEKVGTHNIAELIKLHLMENSKG